MSMNGGAVALAKSPAQTIAETWQARALRESSGKTAAVVMAVLFYSYSEAMEVLLRVIYPGFRELRFPFYTSGATVVKTGKVVCDLATARFGSHLVTARNTLVYESEGELIKEFRDLADRLKFTDAERVQMTTAVQNWVVADLRIDHMGRNTVS
jgi:hypothetical protein